MSSSPAAMSAWLDQLPAINATYVRQAFSGLVASVSDLSSSGYEIFLQSVWIPLLETVLRYRYIASNRDYFVHADEARRCLETLLYFIDFTY